jgi:hypothetical protein
MDEGLARMGNERRGPVRLLLAALGMAGSMMTAGCITVKAPDKPIVIELNINIKQEVVYRLAGDASQTIESNKEVF